MQSEQISDTRKSKFKAKSLAISLLCFCLVCLAAVLPGVLVGMNDEQLYDRFIPTGGTKITAGYTDNTLQQLEIINAFKACRLIVDTDAGDDHLRDAGRIEEYCTLLLRQFGLLQEAGLLSASETEIFSILLTPTSPDLIFSVSTDEDDPRFIGINVMYNFNYICELQYDTVKGRTLSLSITLPMDEFGLAFTPAAAEIRLRAYIDWLGIAELADWSLVEQADGRTVAYSPTADLLLAYQNTTPDGRYRVSYAVS